MKSAYLCKFPPEVKSKKCSFPLGHFVTALESIFTPERNSKKFFEAPICTKNGILFYIRNQQKSLELNNIFIIKL